MLQLITLIISVNIYDRSAQLEQLTILPVGKIFTWKTTKLSFPKSKIEVLEIFSKSYVKMVQLKA